MIKTFLMASAAAVLATTAAVAADLPSRRAPPAYVPPTPAAYSWTGLEFGLTTSYSFRGNKSVSTESFGGTFGQPASTSLSKSGFDTVGGGVAYNYQFTPGSGIVVGAAADVNYFNLQKFIYTGYVGGDGGDYQQRIAYIGTANGRVGYAFDHIMVYGLGGFAYGEVHDSAYLISGSSPNTPYFGTSGNISTGYDYGGGVEYAIPADSILNYLSVEKLLGKFMGGTKIEALSFLDNLSSTLKVEFVHYDLGTRTVVSTSPVAAGGFINRFRTEGNVLRFGLGYKFGGGAAAPVVARY